MGSSVLPYNYLGFRPGDKFGLPPALVGFAPILYLSGTWSSTRAGVRAKTVSRRRLIAITTLTVCMGLGLVLLSWLPALIMGMLTFTAPSFVAHSPPSSGAGLVAQCDRAEVSSMYLSDYYVGSSIVSWVSDTVFGRSEWIGLIPWPVVLSFTADMRAVAGLKPWR